MQPLCYKEDRYMVDSTINLAVGIDIELYINMCLAPSSGLYYTTSVTQSNYKIIIANLASAREVPLNVTL